MKLDEATKVQMVQGSEKSQNELAKTPVEEIEEARQSGGVKFWGSKALSKF